MGFPNRRIFCLIPFWIKGKFVSELKKSHTIKTYHGKVRWSCPNWAPSHEGVLRDWRYSSTHSLTSALHGDEWSVSRPGRFIPRERAPGTHWIWSWVGPRADPDTAVAKRNKFLYCPCRKSKPVRPARSLIIILTELLRVELHFYDINSPLCCGA
jgi:hypothetical protein